MTPSRIRRGSTDASSPRELAYAIDELIFDAVVGPVSFSARLEPVALRQVDVDCVGLEE